MLLYAQLLLCEAPDESELPHDTVVAAQYVDCREMFECTARDWTCRYTKSACQHKPERYFAPRGWGEGELGESINVVDTRRHLREAISLVDAHMESLPEDAYVRIAEELQHAFNSTEWEQHGENRIEQVANYPMTFRNETGKSDSPRKKGHHHKKRVTPQKTNDGDKTKNTEQKRTTRKNKTT